MSSSDAESAERKATCPEGPDHRQFFTTAHVMEEWLVDETGAFIEVVPADGGPLEVVHGPDPGNEWTCAECGAEATLIDGEPDA